MNRPYVKEYNGIKEVINPIKGIYKNPYPNRAQRRQSLKKERFHGESKNHHLSVTKIAKYRRVRQVIECRDPKTKKFTGEIRIIEHYLQ